MNILFVLYGDFSSNSIQPLALYARELSRSGDQCAVAVPHNVESVALCREPYFRPLLYQDVLASPESVFPDKRPADLIHAWTPRENVRIFITDYMAKHPTPLVMYLEDHEAWISQNTLNMDGDVLARQTGQTLSEKLPDALSHPFRYDHFIGLADAAILIQEKLKSEVPPWVYCETILPPVDLEFFFPRQAAPELLRKYGITGKQRVIVYPGGLNQFTRPLLENLCRAVCLINAGGYPCKLLRTGPSSIDFFDRLPPGAEAVILDLGVIPRNELPELMALANVFVQPGQIDLFEDLRLPGKLPEFLAMGRPLILPDVNISDLFTDGMNAVIAKTGDTEELAEKCIELFTHPEKAEAIGLAGRRFAETHFDAGVQAKQLQRVYRHVMREFAHTASETVWRNDGPPRTVSELLALKLRSLATLEQSALSVIEPKSMLRYHADYIEKIQQRVTGLELEMVNRDRKISVLMQKINLQNTEPNNSGWLDELLGITSRRLHSILRIAQRLLFRVNVVFSAFPYAFKACGGLRGLIWRAVGIYRKEGILGIKRRILFSAATDTRLLKRNTYAANYSEWINHFDTLKEIDRKKIVNEIALFEQAPLISVLMPVFDPPQSMLEAAIRSVQNQLYPYWELCIADDFSTDGSVRELLRKYAVQDRRIKVVFRERNGHISAASNSALALVSGEYVALLDQDDLLPEHALFWIAKAITAHPHAGLLYSDEDKLDQTGRRCEPYFKSDWNPDLFLSHNMICHLGVYRTDLVRKLGGFREGYEGAQDYDLALRCIEELRAEQIVHIPRVLYHWRRHSGSTALAGSEKNYALLAGERALNDHLSRQNISARADLLDFGMYRLRYDVPKPPPLVTLIVPTRNGYDLTKNCIESILSKTIYRNYEILLIDNNSDDPVALNYFASLASHERVRVIRDERPFNFSALNNAAARLANGQYLGLINNDIEVISPDWLDEMIGIATQPGVGAVGARLWYPNDTLQHGGVILGVGGVAGHAQKFLKKGEQGYFSRAQLTQTLSAVTAACLVVSKHIYQIVGGLDEINLSVAFNDIDFCLKVKEAGYRNVWTPFAELYHHESATRGIEDTVEKQNRFKNEVHYMEERWGELLKRDPAYNPNLTLEREDFSFAWPPRIELI